MRKFFRILMAAIKGFINDQCYLKGAALTFYTLLSIVPFLAVAIGIAKGFGFDNYLEEQILKTFDEQKDILSNALVVAHSLLKQSAGGLIAGVGVILLLWSNIALLSNVENIFNEMWNVSKSRSWLRRLSDYLTAMILFPLFVVASSSLTVFIRTQIVRSAEYPAYVGWISGYLLVLVKFIPFVLGWVLFSAIYLLLPNVPWRFWPRIAAGIIAGTIFQLWQWIYINFQVYIFNYGAVYGTFAALPLFLVWLQVSWLIVLFGAEIAAKSEGEYFPISHPSKRRLVPLKHAIVLILYQFQKAFLEGNPLTVRHLADDLELKPENVQNILNLLIKQGILVEVKSPTNFSVSAYQERRDLGNVTLKQVSDLSEKNSMVTVLESPTLQMITEYFADYDHAAETSHANFTIDSLREHEH